MRSIICTKYKRKLGVFVNEKDIVLFVLCTFVYILGQSTESTSSVTMLDRLNSPSSN